MASVRWRYDLACDGCGAETFYTESIPFGVERTPRASIDSSWAHVSGWPWHYVLCADCRAAVASLMDNLPAIARERRGL